MKTILTLRAFSALLLAGLSASLAPSASALLLPNQQVLPADFTTSAAFNQAETQSGRAVAVSGNWMAIGAPGRPDTARGSVTVYERIAGVWTRRATLQEPTTPQIGTGFGSAVDIDEVAGRVSVVVGAPLFDQSGFVNAGAVWFYTDQDAGPGVNFPAVGTGSVSTLETEGRFGSAVALQGDWAAVSEPGDGPNDNGLVSIRFRNQNGTNGWGQTQIRTGTGTTGYGFSLDLHGEYLIVGAPQALNAVGVTSGQAIVYRRDEVFANSWGQSWVLSPASPQDGAGFGASVGIWDTDLTATFTPSRAMVGAPQTAVSGIPAVGAVHFFQDATAVIALSPAGNATTRAGQAGYSVAIDGAWAVAGAPGLTVSGNASAGRVHSYGFGGSTWATATADIAQSMVAAGNQYGWSVDVSGDLAVAGAPGTRFDAVGLPPGVSRAGSANGLQRVGAAWALDTPLEFRNTLPNTAVNQAYGGGVAMTTDWLAVGAPTDAQQGTNAGAVYLYRRNGDQWVPHSKLTHPYSQAEQRFGEVLAIDGDRLVVGLGTSSSFPGALAAAGTAVFYRYNGTAWAQVATLSSPNAVANGNFGASVGISGDVLAIGAPGELSDRGRIYAYRDLNAFTAPTVLEINGTVAGDRTATSLAVDDPQPGVPNGEVIAVGIPNVGGGVGIGLVLYGSNFSIRTPLIDPAAVPNGRMGTFIDVHQDRVIIARAGAGLDQARAYIYSGPFYQTREALPLPGGLPTATALPVSLHGNTAVVGLRDVDSSRGRAFAFCFRNSAWSLSDNLQPANTALGDQYGGAVATHSGRAVVGAPLHDPAALANAGTAFTYLPAPEFTVFPGTLALGETPPTDGNVRFSLDRAPAANVSFTLSFDSAQVQVNTGAGFGSSPQTVTLTPANALAGVQVGVRAVDDAIDETDPHAVTLTSSATSSSDVLFQNLDVPDPVVSISDNDVSGARLQRSGGSNLVTEGGSGDSYTISLLSQPVAQANVDLVFATGEITVNGENDGNVTLSFTAANWNTPQTVNLAAVNDRALEAVDVVNLTHIFRSADPNYQAITAVLDGTTATNLMPVQVTDNETATVGWSGPTPSASEGAAALPVVILKITGNGSGPEVLETPVSYQAQFNPGTATAADVGELLGILSFSPGSAHLTENAFQLPYIDDALAEGTETYTLQLTNLVGPPGVTLSPATQAGSILDNDNVGLQVIPSGGSTAATEGGTGDSVSVALTSEPFAPVTVQLHTGTQLDAAPAALVFDAGNWSQPQNVAVAARDDAIAEGTHSGSLGFVLSSSDAGYQGLTVAPIAVTITDNDNAGIQRVESDGSTAVTEGGASDSYTLVLTSEPLANVQIAVSGDAQVGGTPTPLTFTPANWSQPQTVTAQAANDDIAEGSHSGTLSHTVTSTDPNYQGRAVPPVAVAISDNDFVGLAIVQTAGNTAVTEGGTGDSISVALTSQPTAAVSVALTGGTQLSVSPTPLNFTAANWNQPRTVNVAALDDAIAEGPHGGSLGFAVSSTDGAYQGLVVAPMVVAVSDNDNASVIVAQSGGDTRVTEGAAGDTYTLVLSSEPVADVVVAINGDAQASASPATRTFTAANWSVAQTVTVSAVNDNVAEGPHSGTLSHSVTSPDSMYAGLGVAIVPVAITDNDNAGVSLLQSSGDTRATEGGAGDSYTLVLTSQPVADVVIVVSGDAQAGANPSSLSFSAGNWNVAQTVTVAAIDDARVEGNHSGSISHASSSSDPNYQGAVIPAVAVAITDNDVAGVRITPTGGGNAVTEGGAGDSVSITLTSEPTAPVTLTLAPGAQLGASPTSLQFIPASWNVPQTVNLSALDDLVAEGAHVNQIGIGVTSSDGDYQGLAATPIAVSITDNDSAGTALVQTGGSTEVAEGGATDTITFTLSSEPTAPVRITVQPDAQLGVLPATLDFSQTNWQVPQSVTVNAFDDTAVENAHSGALSFAGSSADPFYQGLTLAPLVVQIVDNDGIPEITVMPALSRQQGSAGSVSPVATVFDEQQAAGTLSVSVVAGGSAVGVTATDVVNEDGVVSARLAASCTATSGSLRLRVVDAGGLNATADLQVNVVGNTPPVLSYGLSSVVLSGQLAVSPTSGPSDNGSVEQLVVQSSGSYSGSASVADSGVVQLSDAGPVGTQVLVVRATDNCEASTDATLSVEVSRALSFKRLTADVAPSRFGQPVTFSAELAGVNPSGSVQFFAGTTALGSAPLQPSASGGNNLKLATLSTTQLPVGVSQVRVEYAGDGNNLPAISGNLPHTVLAAGSRIVVTPATNPAPVGPVVLQVQVAAEVPGGGVPAGSVLLTSGSGNQCTTTLSGGQGSCTLNFSTVGYKAVTASYTPAGGNHQASSGAGAVVVVADPSSTDLRVRIGNGVSTIQPGQLLRYLIVADNRGTTAAVGRLQVPLGASFATGTWRCLSASGASCPAAGAMGIGSVDVDLSLDAGAVVVYELLVVAPPPPEAPVSQSAQLSLRSPTTDPQPGNNQATDADPMGLFADGYEDPGAEE